MLSASEAEQMSKRALSTDNEMMKPYMDHICFKIESAAEQGKREITHPFSDLNKNTPYPSLEVQQAVRIGLQKLEYTWTNHPNPDPGHPGSAPYVTISW